MLPYVPDEDQQLERKRHIGNDVIVLVFQDEGSAPLQPELIRSYFNHIFIVVRPVTIDGNKYYRQVRLFFISLNLIILRQNFNSLERRSDAFWSFSPSEPFVPFGWRAPKLLANQEYVVQWSA